MTMDEVPEPESAPGQSLDPRSVVVWRAQVLFRAALVVGAIFLVQLALPGRFAYAALMIGVGAAGTIAALVWPPSYHRSWSFQVRADQLRLRRGVFWRSTSVIPFSRIQHVDTEQGPLERWLGLSRLIVFTAGIRGAENVVPGLAAEEAERLRDALAELGGRTDAV
jgi:uncharacterized protein